MKKSRNMFHVIASFVVFAVMPDIAAGQDEKTAYAQGLEDGFDLCKSRVNLINVAAIMGLGRGGRGGSGRGGGSIYNIKPWDTIGVEKGGGSIYEIGLGDTIVAAIPERGGGSTSEHETENFYMVFNGQNWTAFLKPADLEKLTDFDDPFRFQIMQSEDKSNVIWNLDAAESIDEQMKRLDRGTGMKAEDWSKLHDSASPKLSVPGFKSFEIVKPILEK